MDVVEPSTFDWVAYIKNDTIIKSTSENQADLDDRLNSKIIPIKTDLSQGVQLVLLNPYIYIFKRMGLMLAGTFIIMLLVIVCISYQVRFISRFEKIFQIREDFSYAMIHDMKTPLSTIMMVQDMLESGRIDSKPEIKKKFMNIAKSETDHLLTLTNKILTISKLENHKLEMNKTEVELTPIIETLTDKFKAKAQKPVNFTISLQAKTAYADKDYLDEVLSNLIDNAIKYSKESVEIHITTEESERYTILKVRDNGLGISEADQKVIFQKYERAAAAKRSRRNGASGFGLGLNFVDQVIKAHEGRIFVNSTEGEFTEFTIYLPLETPNNKHIR
jgi:two-component system phosphate regulon sensor histidine kinase PhoR